MNDRQRKALGLGMVLSAGALFVAPWVVLVIACVLLTVWDEL